MPTKRARTEAASPPVRSCHRGRGPAILASPSFPHHLSHLHRQRLTVRKLTTQCALLQGDSARENEPRMNASVQKTLSLIDQQNVHHTRPRSKTKSSLRNMNESYRTPCGSLLRCLEVQDMTRSSSLSTKHRRTACKLQHCLARDQPWSETLKTIHRNEAVGHPWLQLLSTFLNAATTFKGKQHAMKMRLLTRLHSHNQR